MKNCKFKNLVIACYEKAKESSNVVGILYGAISTTSFCDINDIKGFMDTMTVDMMYLKSRVDNVEKDIYAWDVNDFSVDEKNKIINIVVKNKNVVIKY